MELLKLIPNLMVDDVNQTVQYYEEKLDFILAMNIPEDGQWDWAMMKRDDVEIMFQSTKSLFKEMPFFRGRPVAASMTLYLGVDDLSAYFKSLQGKVEILQDPHPTFYGTEEFAVKDLNGYVLVYSQRLR